MAILDKFKKQKEDKTEKKPQVKADLKDEKKSSEGKLQKDQSQKKVKKTLQDLSGTSERQLARPHITEKGNLLAEKGWYVFEVSDKSSKIEIKKAIAKLYNVNVVSVNICKTASKKRRLGRIVGQKKGVKKAMVKLAKGQSLDIFSI